VSIGVKIVVKNFLTYLRQKSFTSKYKGVTAPMKLNEYRLGVT